MLGDLDLMLLLVREEHWLLSDQNEHFKVLNLAPCVERWEPHHHLVDKVSEGPPVDSRLAAFSRVVLWCNVVIHLWFALSEEAQLV